MTIPTVAAACGLMAGQQVGQKHGQHDATKQQMHQLLEDMFAGGSPSQLQVAALTFFFFGYHVVCTVRTVATGSWEASWLSQRALLCQDMGFITGDVKQQPAIAGDTPNINCGWFSPGSSGHQPQQGQPTSRVWPWQVARGPWQTASDTWMTTVRWPRSCLAAPMGSLCPLEVAWFYGRSCGRGWIGLYRF